MVARNGETSETKRTLYGIGINLGDILIEGDDVDGDGVKMTTRLESICEPGEKDLKNIAAAVWLYTIKPSAEVTTTLPLRPCLIGKGLRWNGFASAG